MSGLQAMLLVFIFSFVSCEQNEIVNQEQEINVTRLDSLDEVNNIIAPKQFLWKKKELNVLLKSGSQKNKKLVKFFAKDWTEYANIQFNFFDAHTTGVKFHISIDILQIAGGFMSSGVSYIGTGSESVARRSQTSMTLRFSQSASPADIKGLVLHEFGHALGLGHEHQHPDRIFVYNEAAILKHCLDVLKQDETRCRENNLDVYNAKDHISFTYDSKSIMHYSLHAEYLQEYTADQEIFKDAKNLSLLDKIAIAKIYPGKITEDQIRIKHQEHEDHVYSSDKYGNCSLFPFVSDSGQVTYSHVNDLDPSDKYRRHFVFNNREDVLLNMQFDPICGSPLSAD